MKQSKAQKIRGVISKITTVLSLYITKRLTKRLLFEINIHEGGVSSVELVETEQKKTKL